MKTQTPIERPTRRILPAPMPQLAVRSNMRAGLSGDCSLGVSYWRKELNSLRQVADALGCR